MFPSASPNDHGIAINFPQIPDVPSYPPFWCYGFSGYRGNAYGADAPMVHLGTPIHNNDISLSEFHKPSHHPSLIQWRGVTSDVSRTATPMSMQSSYSNSSGYANPAQSSQSNASVPAAPFSSPSLHVPDGISQYERNRQKNRAATARCREKTQQYTQELREQERDLLSKKQSLKACIADLQDEVLALKTEILQHSHCDCDHIQRYLRAAASQVA
ncbi:hypothetical protein E8E14_000581 [Neopestalotiopsis sp. 37M]|nr:hypothetical protein E8E14_000581 [Neopestalotiopsis sp. 37M]